MTYETTHLSNIKTWALNQWGKDTTYPSRSKTHVAIQQTTHPKFSES